MYLYGYSPDQTLSGYTNFSLSEFKVQYFAPQSVPDDPKMEIFGNVTQCRFVSVFTVFLKLIVVKVMDKCQKQFCMTKISEFRGPLGLRTVWSDIFFIQKLKKKIATYGKEIQLYQPLSGMRKHFIISCKFFCLHSDTVDTLRTTRAVLGSTSIRWPTGTSWPPNWPLLSFLRSDFFLFNIMNPFFCSWFNHH